MNNFKSRVRRKNYRFEKIGMKLLLALSVLLLVVRPALAQQVLYQQDFEKIEIGKLPEDFLVLDGDFSVKQEGTNKFLELPGAPLETYAVQFGPAREDGVSIQARIRSSSKGRRFPVFGVGLNGVAGYKLRVAPAKNQLGLCKDQEVKATADWQWKSGTWAFLKLQVPKNKEGGWLISGKAWSESDKEPDKWLVTWLEKDKPPAARPSVLASPFAGTPIQFDDIVVSVAN